MLWFTNTKKEENVPKTYIERLELLETEVRKQKNELIGLNMDMDTLRNKVLRKIQAKREQEEQEKDVDAFGIPLI